MGLTSKQLAELALSFGITVGELTPAQKKAGEKMFSLGKNEGTKESTTETDESSSPIDTRTTEAGFIGGPLVDLLTGLPKLEQVFSPSGIGKGVDELINGSQKLANSMGIGKARAAEFRSLIAETGPEFIKLGLTQDDAIKTMAEIPKSLGVNTTLTKETIVEIGAASEISGKNAGLLANEFKGVGFNLADVGNKMADVANYAKSIGVNVTAVAGKVVENIGKLNTLNFQGGIQGLTKMVAQSEMLGINMDKVFAKGEELLNPESAIEFSAALQRLGVQSSSLLDPLSAMDMALNDPAELMNQMTKVSQQFTRLKADGSGFEILPGAKLQLREVAKSMGMTADEFANMSIKSADLEMKMSKIRFPSFAASEEDKTLLANMAQMKDGRAIVTIANKEGGTDEVAIEELTADQITKLKEEQANQNKTAEDIARDQLTVLQDISAQLGGATKSLQMGVASSGVVQRMTNTANELRKTATSVVTERITTKKTRETISPILGGVEAGVVGSLAKGDPTVLFEELFKLPGKIVESASSIAGGGLSALTEAITKGTFNVLKEYEGVSGVKASEVDLTSGLTSYIDKLKEAITGGEKGKETSNNFSINQTIDVKGSSDQITRENVFKWNDEWWSDITKDPSKMNKVTEGMDKSMSGSGMAK